MRPLLKDLFLVNVDNVELPYLLNMFIVTIVVEHGCSRIEHLQRSFAEVTRLVDIAELENTLENCINI
jgi:hypothetical protein